MYLNGKMSSYIRFWQVGDMIEWRGPYGNFSYVPNQVKNASVISLNDCLLRSVL